MNADEPSTPAGEEAGANTPLAPPERKRPVLVPLALTFAGAVLPLICFAISFPERPRWQSGRYEEYAKLLLSHAGSAPQYPFLLYSMVCLVLLVWRPERWRDRSVVRLGIYLGVLLAAEFWVVFHTALGGTESGYMLPLFFSALAVAVTWAAGKLNPWAWVAIAVLFGLMVLASGGDFLGLGIFLALWCSTTWAFASYAYLAVGLLRARSAEGFRFSLTQLLAIMGALSAHLAAWRLSFLQVLDDYAQLPTTAPHGCFVCTAAAGGHPRFVRSEVVHSTVWGPQRVNDQLRYLKAFELLLLRLCPGAHAGCRRIYNRLGPRAAAWLRHPLAADAGYLLLKPAEWLARLCLILAIPGHGALIRRLYRSTETGKP
jgi:hypothetical protein